MATCTPSSPTRPRTAMSCPSTWTSRWSCCARATTPRTSGGGRAMPAARRATCPGTSWGWVHQIAPRTHAGLNSFLSTAVPTCAAAVAALQRLAVNTLHHPEAQGRPTHPEALHIQVHLGWGKILSTCRRRSQRGNYLSQLEMFLFVYFLFWEKQHKGMRNGRARTVEELRPYAHPYGMAPTAAVAAAASASAIYLDDWPQLAGFCTEFTHSTHTVHNTHISPLPPPAYVQPQIEFHLSSLALRPRLILIIHHQPPASHKNFTFQLVLAAG